MDVDESPVDGELPTELVARLAGEKAAALAEPGELVLAADTIVVLDNEILGKPGDRDAAISMLSRLRGREHEVLTGVALLEAASARTAQAIERSRVKMADLSTEEIVWYVETGEPMDKAGAYAIQGLGALFVEAVNGSYTNVVGLPLPTVYRLFRELGFDLLAFRDGTGSR